MRVCYEQNGGVAWVNQWLFRITRSFINPLNVTPGEPSPGDPADKHPLCLLLFICICFFLCDDDWLLKVRNTATKCCMFTLIKKCLTFRVKHHGCIVMFCNIWGLKRKSMAVSSSTKNSSLSGWKSVETILDAISCSPWNILVVCNQAVHQRIYCAHCSKCFATERLLGDCKVSPEDGNNLTTHFCWADAVTNFVVWVSASLFEQTSLWLHLEKELLSLLVLSTEPPQMPTVHESVVTY